MVFKVSGTHRRRREIDIQMLQQQHCFVSQPVLGSLLGCPMELRALALCLATYSSRSTRSPLRDWIYHSLVSNSSVIRLRENITALQRCIPPQPAASSFRQSKPPCQKGQSYQTCLGPVLYNRLTWDPCREIRDGSKFKIRKDHLFDDNDDLDRGSWQDDWEYALLQSARHQSTGVSSTQLPDSPDGKKKRNCHTALVFPFAQAADRAPKRALGRVGNRLRKKCKRGKGDEGERESDPTKIRSIPTYCGSKPTATSSTMQTLQLPQRITIESNGELPGWSVLGWKTTSNKLEFRVCSAAMRRLGLTSRQLSTTMPSYNSLPRMQRSSIFSQPQCVAVLRSGGRCWQRHGPRPKQRPATGWWNYSRRIPVPLRKNKLSGRSSQEAEKRAEAIVDLRNQDKWIMKQGHLDICYNPACGIPRRPKDQSWINLKNKGNWENKLGVDPE
ncbi:hypothetical protein B0H66DRAFT_537384 [Apodospora peruviana]|uniref:Uncharacterized protein n=1 Tax=Apodospora peruviana TaxID=516989 RepID=A0AAE0HY41_9PEZI|nr:hypothetical protein B0H66DRAFT_537384 [Apodospora peruviana]